MQRTRRLGLRGMRTLALMLFGLALGMSTTWAIGETRPGHSVSLTPGRVPGTAAPKTGTFVVTGSDLSANALKLKLGRGATVRKIAAGLEVTGVSAGQLAAVSHGLTSTSLHVTEKGRQGRSGGLSAENLMKLNALNEAMVQYGLSRNFGQSITGGIGPTLGGSIYPVPQCWRMVCADCGPAPVGGTDCSEFEKAKDRAYDEYMKAAAKQEIWQAASQAYKDMAFYGGVAGMISDMVSAASTVLSAGTATGAAKAGAKLLIEMARDGALEALMVDLGIPGLSEMTEAAVDAELAKAEAARVAAAKALEQARKAWVDCMNTPGAMTPAQLQAHKQAVSRYDGCRYRVYLGEAPECELAEATCP